MIRQFNQTLKLAGKSVQIVISILLAALLAVFLCIFLVLQSTIHTQEAGIGQPDIEIVPKITTASPLRLGAIPPQQRLDAAPHLLEKQENSSRAQETNLIPNWSFEDPIPDLDNWQTESRSGDQFPIFFWSSGIHHGNGEHSAGIIDDSKKEKSSWVSAMVPIVEENEQLEFSGWIYATSLRGKAYINLAFYDAGKNHLSGQDIRSKWVNDSGDWVQRSGMALAPDGAAFVRVECSLVGTGAVWFDEISLTGVSERTPILNLEQNDEPDPVEAGKTLVYHITYSNTGIVSTRGVFITDTFDTNVTPSTSSYPLHSTGSHWWSWNIGQVEANSSGAIVVTVTVNSPLTGSLMLSNSVKMSGEEHENVIDEELTQVIATPQLSISKIGRPDPVKPGETLIYTITHGNNGAAQATDVVVCDEFDFNVTFGADTCTPNPDVFGKSWACWQPGKLEAGEQRIIACPVLVTSTAQSYSVLQNVGWIQSRQTGRVEASATTKVTGSPPYKLTIEPREQANSALPGSSVIYTFTVTNHGSETDHVRLEAISLRHWDVITHVVEPDLSYLQSALVFVTTTVPTNAESGDYDRVTIIARSLNPAGDASAVITTTTEQSACLSISPGSEVVIPPSQAIGRVVTFTHIITNCGNGTDVVTVTVGSTMPYWLTPTLTSFTMTIPAWSSKLIVVTATILREPGEGESRGYLWVSATSWADDSEMTLARNQVDVRWQYVFLPLVLKNYAVFCNGDFETGDPSCWTKYDDPKFPVGVIGSQTDPGYNCFNTYALRIGRTGKLPDGEMAIGSFGIAQAVVVSNVAHPTLEFEYCMCSYDLGKWDSFGVAIDNPTNVLTSTGNPATSTHCESLWKSQPRPARMSLDLKDFRGEAVTIYFLVWAREPEGITVSHCNTWVYVDNIDGDFVFKR